MEDEACDGGGSGTAFAAIFDAFDFRIPPLDRSAAVARGDPLLAREKHSDDAGLAARAHMYGFILVTRRINGFDGQGA